MRSRLIEGFRSNEMDRKATMRVLIDRFADSLNELGCEEGYLISMIVDALEHAPIRIQIAGARALQSLEHPRAESSLHTLLRSPGREVRVAASESLRTTGTSRSLNALETAVAAETDLNATDIHKETLSLLRERSEKERGQISVASTAGSLSLGNAGALSELQKEDRKRKDKKQ